LTKKEYEIVFVVRSGLFATGAGTAREFEGRRRGRERSGQQQ